MCDVHPFVSALIWQQDGMDAFRRGHVKHGASHYPDDVHKERLFHITKATHFTNSMIPVE